MEFPSQRRAQRSDRRDVLIAGLVSALLFVALAPFATRQLPEIRGFIPAYQAALAIIDVVTAILLYAQVVRLRSFSLLLLADGYLFAAMMAVVHALTFPRLFAPTGLLGAGPQTTAWLYMFWHAGFPAMVAVYALTKDRAPLSSRATRLAIGASLIAIVAVVILLTLIATSTDVPPIMSGNSYTPLMIGVVTTVWACSMGAFIVLCLRLPYSVLDVWLTLAMLAWMFDVALSAVLNAGRFDLGFYAGRLYGLAASALLLVVLIVDSRRKA